MGAAILWMIHLVEYLFLKKMDDANLKVLDPDTIKVDQKSYKNIVIHYIKECRSTVPYHQQEKRSHQ